jgi:hypothetical protein
MTINPQIPIAPPVSEPSSYTRQPQSYAQLPPANMPPPPINEIDDF